MKKYLAWLLLLLPIFGLISCATGHPSANLPYPTDEYWLSDATYQPTGWVQGADAWFKTGAASQTEIDNRRAQEAGGISTIKVDVQSFASIKANGCFQTQVFGSDHLSVYLFGPTRATRAIHVRVVDGVLYVTQTRRPVDPRLMSRVIVRIGVVNLHKLVQCGIGSIEAIRLNATPLEVVNVGRGDMYVTGAVNLQQATLRGSGSIYVFGAKTRHLSIFSAGYGSINVVGQVGLHAITHHNWGDINVIGALPSDSLIINADCAGKISIVGRIPLCRINARGNVRVYLCAVDSHAVFATTYDHAVVGLSGFSDDLTVNTNGYSSFLGSHLCVRNAYVEAHDFTHANVTANAKIFANADQRASIYFYGPSALLTSFGTNSGSIIALGMRNSCNVTSEFRPYSYTLDHFRAPIRHAYARINYKSE